MLVHTLERLTKNKLRTTAEILDISLVLGVIANWSSAVLLYVAHIQ